jgi:hypothetical protein
MSYYYEMKIKTPERVKVYYAKLKQPLDFSSGRPEGVTFSRLERETYKTRIASVRHH